MTAQAPGDKPAMDAIKAVHIPWDAENHYQQNLTDALAKQGVEAGNLPQDSFNVTALFGLKPQVVHFHWLHHFCLLSSGPRNLLNLVKLAVKIRLIKRRGIKVVWTAHNLKDHGNRSPVIDYLCTGMVAAAADAIIVHCQTAKLLVKKRFPFLRPDKIRIMAHGNYIDNYPDSIDPLFARDALGLSADSFVILFLGNVRAYKGVLELIDCYREWSGGRDAVLLIAGQPIDEEMSRQVRERTADREDIVFLPGKVKDEDIQKFMKAADVTVFPYRSILTSGAVILAMSFAKPVIAPRMGCIGDILDDKGAFLYNPADRQGLAAALARAAANREKLSEMGHHNLELAEKYDWDKIGAVTKKVYMSVLEKTRSK